MKYQLNTITSKNKFMQAFKKDRVNSTDPKFDMFNLNGDNINFIGGLEQTFHHKIYCNNCIKEMF